MFENQKFLTRGVMAEIPLWLTNLMWHMVLTMEVEDQDYLQVFTLTKTPAVQHTSASPARAGGSPRDDPSASAPWRECEVPRR